METQSKWKRNQNGNTIKMTMMTAVGIDNGSMRSSSWVAAAGQQLGSSS